MDLYNIFLDESGNSDLKSYGDSPYFTVCGVLVSEKTRIQLRKGFEELKLKYFKDKKYIVHSVVLRKTLWWKWHIDRPNYLAEFARDLDKFLKSFPFYLLMVTVQKEKALKRTWNKKVFYERVYRGIIGNLVKFLTARDAIGNIYSEACSLEQDVYLYQSFFHFATNGMSRLGIDPKTVKRHLTSLCFVTKKNHDCEEQIADLFGSFGRIELEIKKGIIKVENLDEINQVLYQSMKKQLVVPKAIINQKKELYESINPFVVLP